VRAFERQDGETVKAFEAFKVYRDLGPERSLAKVAEIRYGKTTSNARQVARWSSRFDWVERAAAWDDYHEMIRREIIEECERAKGTERAEREARIQERVLAVREQFVERLEQMLGAPLQGDKWNYATITKAVEVLEGRHQRIDIRKMNLGHLSDEDLERIASGEDPLQVLLDSLSQGDEEGYGG